jgi:16S rRNA (guanine527-N7)-methyltransferase
MLRDAMPSPLTPETELRLTAYAELLLTWTQRINLISQADQPHIWTRHIADSLRLLPHIPPNTTRAIDLGSGAGLPGLILAIATGIPFDLVESDRRKAAFLGEAARITHAPAKIHGLRIEDATIAPAPLITARALAPLDKLLTLATPLLAPGGTMLFLKGARAPEEIEAARLHWTFECATHGADHPILAITSPQRVHAHA